MYVSGLGVKVVDLGGVLGFRVYGLGVVEVSDGFSRTQSRPLLPFWSLGSLVVPFNPKRAPFLFLPKTPKAGKIIAQNLEKAIFLHTFEVQVGYSWV